MSDWGKGDCPFCALDTSRILAENLLAIAMADAFPVSPGHTLIVSRRHVANFFQLSPEERTAILDLLFQMRSRLLAEHSPGGFNVGVNVGPVAGQTVMHVHVHLIPRYERDVTDPAGGVRNVVPGKGRYG
jgi:diadenosine tetraphosphate (Ap4A) HIT family hydrolase